ncbi:hypothetical protein IXB28_13700 [Leptothoe kymatousa TAU-MAC 1615]|uniref:Uncharacterized protein n=2 Tax=Leptothoe TaxID=2651725 RepID=A0ABS5Y622_9CYAN|nr:hypothetical protein [Leptothoe kymatousa TAU-MAC 1615]
MADELFIALEPSSIYSDDPFGKFYFQWEWHPVHGWSPDLKPTDGRWVFNGTLPIDTTWKSRFATEINDNKQPD